MSNQKKSRDISGSIAGIFAESFEASLLTFLNIGVNPGGSLAKFIAKSYSSRPRATILSIIAVLGIIGSLAAVLDSTHPTVPAIDTSSQFSAQVKALDDAESSLKQSIEFLQQHKRELTELEGKLSESSREHERLRTLVSADSNVLNLILHEHQRRVEDATRYERWFGFGMGLLSSLLASLVFYFGVRFINSRRAVRVAGDEADGI